MARGAVVNSGFNNKRGHGHYSLWQWIGRRFINILLSAVIFFLAGLLVNMYFFPRVYESEADIYVAAVSGNTKVSASALGDVLKEKAQNEITAGLSGFGSVPVSQQIRIETDLGDGIVKVGAASADPYSAFDAVTRAIDISYEYMEENSAQDSIRIVSYPVIAKHFSYLAMLRPAIYAAIAGAFLAFILAIFSYSRYKREYIAEKKRQEQMAASAYAAFAPDNMRAGASSRVVSSQEDMIKSLEEDAVQPDDKVAGDNLRKIMSAKDPDDDSGKITIPAYHEEADSLDDDDAVNFLHFSQMEDPDVSIEDEFDEDAEEEDLARLFSDASIINYNASDEGKGGS